MKMRRNCSVPASRWFRKLSLLVGAALAGQAHASDVLIFCNKTGASVEYAQFVFSHGENTTASAWGWARIKPNQCDSSRIKGHVFTAFIVRNPDGTFRNPGYAFSRESERSLPRERYFCVDLDRDFQEKGVPYAHDQRQLRCPKGQTKVRAIFVQSEAGNTRLTITLN